MRIKNKILFIIIVILVAAIIEYGNFNFNNFNFNTQNLSYSKLNENLEKARVTKIIDGDTIIVEGGRHIRLLGIDTDEKGYPCYIPAKKRLEELILNKEVYLERDKEDKDQYGRYLRYVFIENNNTKENVNLRMVKEGLAVARFYENEKYKEEIMDAEKFAIENKIGCKWNYSK